MELIGSGRDADVYALGDGRVLRRYRDGRDVSTEADVMRHVAAHGVPVPEVFDVTGPDLVMERVAGLPVVESVAAGEMGPEQAGETLASIQRRLHAVAPLLGANPGDRILHLDLHPHNVVVTAAGPVLIDWSNAAEGPASLDVAVSALILAEASLGSYVSFELAPAVRRMLVAFLRASRSDPLGHLDRAREYRRADPNLDASEIARLDEAGHLVAGTWRSTSGSYR